MTDPLERFRLDYAPLLLRHLSQRDESGLQAAYELGRRAMEESVGLLDVVRVHNDLFLKVLGTVRDLDEIKDLNQAAATILIDLIASFEVAQRGFMDVRQRPPLT
nr:phosphatase RsbU N-terminal domain-containing protein [uncultured Nocardioides sp.]